MSNFNNDDDFFDDFDNDNDFGLDDDFSFDNDPDPFAGPESGAGLGDDFDFGDDNLDGSYDDVGLGMDDGGDTPDGLVGEAEQDSGPNRGFIIGLGLLVLSLIVQIAVIAFLLLSGPSGPSELQQTATAIVLLNETVFAQSTETADALAIAQTETTIAQSVTPTPTTTPTNTRPPTNTPSPTLDDTAVALTSIPATETAEALALAQTADAEATNAAETPEGPGPEAIFATSTALAQFFADLTATAEGGGVVGEVTPTVDTGQATEAPGGTTGGGELINQGELPNTGLFDDVGALSSLGLIALAAFGLLGVIAFSRQMRARVNKDDE